MAHVPRLTQQLRALLQQQRVAALGTITGHGAPLVSMVPFAVEPAAGWFVVHVSALAAHTGNLEARPGVSLMVMQSERAGEPVHALPRVTFDGMARTLERERPQWHAAREAYLKRFPEAEPMTQLGDFRFIAIELTGARQVAGFGAARSISAEELRAALVFEQ